MTPLIIEQSIWFSLLYGASIYLIMWLCSRVLLQRERFKGSLTPQRTRYGAIDGLRGLLAVVVLVHHSSAIYGYFTAGVWQYGENNLLNQFGKASVAMFFMLTAFLFTNKALGDHMDWKSFYLARGKRLFPLYFLVINVVFLAIFIKSDFSLKESLLKVTNEYFEWMTFVVFARPDINGMKDSAVLIACVNWSLKFEVLFCLMAVPLLYIASRFLSLKWLIISGIATAVIEVIMKVALHIELNTCIFNYTCGILIALLFRVPLVRGIFCHRYYHGFALLALIALGLTQSGPLTIGLLFFIFSAVVGGASLWGMLTTRPAIWLGDISYGIFLLHGLILYALLSVLTLNFEHEGLNDIDILMYWPLVLGVALTAVALASVSYTYLEKPIMGRKPQETRTGPEPERENLGGSPVKSVHLHSRLNHSQDPVEQTMIGSPLSRAFCRNSDS
jgi:peptidoglycan/LPS O-acetylase OafA/YrhL